MKEKKKIPIKQDILRLLLSIFSAIFILGGSFLIYYFSKGYRINISDGEITQVGVLSVQTEPSYANLYINGDTAGKTPKTRTLDTGTYIISAWKENYREWKKEIDILEEKSTQVYPFLILEQPEKTTLWESSNSLEKYWINENKDTFVFLQKSSETEYSLLTYRVNTPLWNLSSNPSESLTLQTNNIELNISPNGQLALLTITTDETTDNYLIELQKTNTLEVLTPLEISNLSDYKTTWSLDNRHLIFESDQDIISLDTVKDTRYLIIKKSPDQNYIWSTDQEGFFYIVEQTNTEEDSTYTYALKQTKLDGTNPKYTIEKVYFQKNKDYIDYYRSNGDTFPDFTNSPESTQAIGEITFFDVNQSANGVYIKTDTSAYWYDMETEKYRMISPYPADLIEFSPDSRKLLFGNGGYIYVFTFDKDEGDHTEQLGSKRVDSLLREEISEIHWLSNSLYVYYIKDSNLYISEKDGDNNQQITETQNILLLSIEGSKKYIVDLEQDNLSFSINKYQIN